MRYGHTGGAFAVGLLLSACAVVSPLLDRSLAEAPFAACGAINGPPPLGPPNAQQRARTGAQPKPMTQCFALFRDVQNGPDTKWAGGRIEAGETLLAVYTGGKGCFGLPDDLTGPRVFSYLTVTGSSDGAGKAELSVWDVAGRALYVPGGGDTTSQRTIEWPRAFRDRTFSMANAGGVLQNAAGARIHMVSGSFDPAHLCFKGF
jgi:hypothetical protein